MYELEYNPSIMCRVLKTAKICCYIVAFLFCTSLIVNISGLVRTSLELNKIELSIMKGE